jgi:hypothetical protein
MDFDKYINERFDESDRDSGTGGFCAMFALAAYRTFIKWNPELVLICHTVDNELLVSKRGAVYWKHAAIKINGKYYDIEGFQEPKWLLDNYLWGLVRVDNKIIEPDRGGIILPLAIGDFTKEIRKTKSAVDMSFYRYCVDKLAQ